MGFFFPPAVAPGDLVAVVAPSSPFELGEFWRGLGWLRDRYEIFASPTLLGRSGYLAGDDDRRARELERAMLEPQVKAIIAARGGYGAMRVLSRLPWDAFQKNPRWMVGFSDITALHCMTSAFGIAAVHASHVTGVTQLSPRTKLAWMRAIERPHDGFTWGDLRVLRAGRAEGTLFGGNLALIEAMAAAGKLVVPEGAIVLLEDVTERPYRIDRMLTSLILGGHLARASAIVLGEFVRCDAGPDGVTVDQVLEQRLGELGVPIVSAAPFGHGLENQPFVLGSKAELVAGCLRVGAKIAS
jgi:muramoyltetrapeptide carboxypeptidase